MLRKEDPALLTGEARYTDDLVIPGALHLAVVRSPYAHARITVDRHLGAAAAMPGVVAVYTGADLRDDWAAPMPCAWPVTEDMKNPAHYPLAIDTVCYVGDGVAVVVAAATPRRTTRSRRSSSTTTRCRRSSTSRTPLTDRVVVHEELGTNTLATPGSSRSRAPRRGRRGASPTPRSRSTSATSSSA